MNKFIRIFIFSLLLLGIKNEQTAEEIKTEVEEHNNPATELLKDLHISIQNKTLDIELEIRSSIKKVQAMVASTFSAIDEMTLRNSWREGLAVQKDLQFETDITFYKLKSVYDYPCKSINFLFGIKSDFEVFKFNANRYLLCFLKFYHHEIKELLTDVVVTGTINILKSGASNPISTFFTNILIIEGPLKLKEELFGALYKYVEENSELNRSFMSLIEQIILLNFDKKANHASIENFKKFHSTSLIFFFYDMIIIYLEDKEIYLSAYDFIQPDANLINNPDSMDPKYVTDKYSQILIQDLNRFKEIQKNYQTNTRSTVYHKTYAMYITKNIRLLCRIIYKVEDC